MSPIPPFPFDAEIVQHMSSLSLQPFQSEETTKSKGLIIETLQEIEKSILANSREHPEASKLFPTLENLQKEGLSRLQNLEENQTIDGTQETQKESSEAWLKCFRNRCRREIRVSSVWRELATSSLSPNSFEQISPSDPHFWIPFAQSFAQRSIGITSLSRRRYPCSKLKQGHTG